MKYVKWLVLALVLLALCRCAVGAEERILNLPEDSAKWHVSVVGSGERFQEILGWFETGSLKSLKDKTFFHRVAPNTAIYKERYAPNTSALPMVRVQDKDGYVIYEACGNRIPATGAFLYSSIEAAANRHYLLPYRRNHRTQPLPDTRPDIIPDIAPQPISDGEAPFKMLKISVLILAALALGVMIGRIEYVKRGEAK